jgi:Spy/CpxP family protein refolding chaperone
MRFKNNAILGLLTLALCAPLALAQGTMGQDQTPPPAQQGQSQGPRGMGPGGQRGPGGPGAGHMGPGGHKDGQGRGGMRGQMNGRRNWGHHGMRGRMGHRGGNGFRGGHGMWGGGRGMMGRSMGQGFGGGRGMGRGGQMGLNRIVNNPSLRQQLGITPDQVAKITQQETDFQKAGIQGRAILEVKHLELRQLMSAPTPDRAAIDSKLQEINTAQLASEKLNVHHQLDMKSALTADQQAKLKTLMQARRQGGRGGPHGPGGPGAGRPQSQPKQPGSGDQPISPDGKTN